MSASFLEIIQSMGIACTTKMSPCSQTWCNYSKGTWKSDELDMKPAVGKEKSKLQGVLGIRDNHQFINICLKSFQKLLTDGFFLHL